MIKVKNLVNERGNEVKNQFDITSGEFRYFQSYNSLIAKWDGIALTLGRDWDYSQTTLKYLYQWMRQFAFSAYLITSVGANRKEAIRRAIKAGQIEYDGGMY